MLCVPTQTVHKDFTSEELQLTNGRVSTTISWAAMFKWANLAVWAPNEYQARNINLSAVTFLGPYYGGLSLWWCQTGWVKKEIRNTTE